MDKQRLIETLQQLQAELAKTDRVAPETVARLEQLTEEIQNTTHRDDQTDADVEPASNSLKDLLLKFEAEHPEFSASVGRVADALAAMGI